MKSNFYLLLVLVIIVAAYLIWFAQGQSLPGVTDPGVGREGVICTMEAKQCPDGSYVGRQGPNCEFTPCP